MVVGEFIRLIEFLGATGEDFGDEFGVTFDIAVFAIAWVAGNEGVGVVVELVFIVDFDFVIDAAWRVFEVTVNQAK